MDSDIFEPAINICNTPTGGESVRASERPNESNEKEQRWCHSPFFCARCFYYRTTKWSTLSYSFVCCVLLFKGNSNLIYTRRASSFFSISFRMVVCKNLSWMCLSVCDYVWSVCVCTLIHSIVLYNHLNMCLGHWIRLCINWYNI